MYLTTCVEPRMFCIFIAFASAGHAELGLRSSSLIPLRLERLVRITAVSLWVLGTDLAPGFRSTWGLFYVSMEQIPASDPEHLRQFRLLLSLLEIERKAHRLRYHRTRRR